ncbi:MAG: hypothetical protein OEX12_11555 [Gammaproteobacteria bacterium]|nr:hypothetical protein [Gammaproteobacteria bacterium]
MKPETIHMQQIYQHSYCGAKPDMKYPWHTSEVTASSNFTNNRKEVTCETCKKLMSANI